jgi:hypothetical protein
MESEVLHGAGAIRGDVLRRGGVTCMPISTVDRATSGEVAERQDRGGTPVRRRATGTSWRAGINFPARGLRCRT